MQDSRFLQKFGETGDFCDRVIADRFILVFRPIIELRVSGCKRKFVVDISHGLAALKVQNKNAKYTLRSRVNMTKHLIETENNTTQTFVQ